jgi:hypothetical protein
MSVWTWIEEFHEQARAANDTERLRLWPLATEAGRVDDTDPEQALSLLAEGAALADHLGEPWWGIFFAHWRAQTLLFYARDLNAALDLAQRTMVEVRKPIYAELPQRICVHEDVIHAYAGRDPLGYAPLIRDALTYMQREVTPELECYACVLELEGTFALGVDDFERAKQLGLRLLEHADAKTGRSREHNRTRGFALLCQVAVRRKDWDALASWSGALEASARALPTERVIAEALLWQALAARHHGNASRAHRLCLAATTQAAKLGAEPSADYYDALSAYHVLGGDTRQALAVRDWQLERLRSKGRLAEECHCRMARCHLLKESGLPLRQDVAEARQVIMQLRDPRPALSELEQFEHPGVPPSPA